MRILFISYQYPPNTEGGIGSYVSVIAPALAQRGHDVHVLSCDWGLDTEDVVRDGVHLHRRPRLSFRGLGLLRAPRAAARVSHALSCRRWLKDLKMEFDVVEAADYMAEGALIPKDPPMILHLHSGTAAVEQHWSRKTTHEERWVDRIEREAVRRSVAQLCPSRFLVDELKANGWLDASQEPAICRYPIDSSIWEQADPVENTGPKLLFVGRLEWRKAPETIIQAVGHLDPQSRPAITYVGASVPITAGGDYREWLMASARELGVSCEFLGPQPRHQLLQLYSQARAVVIPSRFDNFPMVALEALSAGRPVVCTSYMGTSEILEGERAGRVVAPDDVPALAAAIYGYTSDVSAATAAGARGRAIVREQCSPSKVAAEHEDIYRSAIAKGL